MAHSILWRIPTVMIVFSVLSTSVWVSFDHHYLDWYSGHEHLIVVLGHTHDYGGMDLPDTYSHHETKNLDGTYGVMETYTGSFLDKNAGIAANAMSIDAFDKELLVWMLHSSSTTIVESPQIFPSGIQVEVPTPPPNHATSLV